MRQALDPFLVFLVPVTGIELVTFALRMRGKLRLPVFICVDRLSLKSI